MPCSCTCKCCGRKFDRYSGYLLNISDGAIEILKEKNPSLEGHSVLCSDCIEKSVNRNIISFNLLKWKVVKGERYWYTSNYFYFLRKFNFKLDDSLIRCVSRVDLKGIIREYPYQYLWSINNHKPIDIRDILK